MKQGADSKHRRHEKRELCILERFLRQFHMVMLNESIVLVFRCPGEMEEPPLEETESALAVAREVCDAELSRLPAEVRP